MPPLLELPTKLVCMRHHIMPHVVVHMAVWLFVDTAEQARHIAQAVVEAPRRVCIFKAVKCVQHAVENHDAAVFVILQTRKQPCWHEHRCTDRW